MKNFFKHQASESRPHSQQMQAPAKPAKKLCLTNEIEAMFFQCLIDEDFELTRRKKQLIVAICMALFPELRKHAKAGMPRPKRVFRQHNLWFYGISAILIIGLLLLVIQKYA